MSGSASSIQVPLELAATMKALRTARGLSQVALASAAGVSRPTVSEFETNGVGRVDSLLRLLAALGVSLSIGPALEGDTPDPPSHPSRSPYEQ